MGKESPFMSHKLATDSFCRLICFMRRKDEINSHLWVFILTDQNTVSILVRSSRKLTIL